jgi:hypothetical protein
MRQPGNVRAVSLLAERLVTDDLLDGQFAEPIVAYAAGETTTEEFAFAEQIRQEQVQRRRALAPQVKRFSDLRDGSQAR